MNKYQFSIGLGGQDTYCKYGLEEGPCYALVTVDQMLHSVLANHVKCWSDVVFRCPFDEIDLQTSP